MGRTGSCISHWSDSSWVPGYLPTAWIWVPDTYWVIRATQQQDVGYVRGQWRRLSAQLKGPRPGGWVMGSIVHSPPPLAITGSASVSTRPLAETGSCSPPRRHVLARTSLGLQPCWSWPLLCHWPLGCAAWAPRKFLAWLGTGPHLEDIGGLAY